MTISAPPPISTSRDLYEELGAARGATAEEISAAYRARAKELHPDARPDDASAGERFARVGAAYRVLADPVARARYDASLAPRPSLAAGSVAAPSLTPARPRPSFRLTRRTARFAVAGGTLLVLLGIVVGAFVFLLQRHDDDLRAHGIAVVATEVLVNGERRLEFETRSGRVVRATESVKTGEEQPALGSRVPIHYDRDHPSTITTDQSHTGRNVTLWIVAVKFTIGGAVLLGFGIRRLRRA